MIPDHLTREVLYFAFCNMGAAYERALAVIGVQADLARKNSEEIMACALDVASAPGEAEAFMARLSELKAARRRGMN